MKRLIIVRYIQLRRERNLLRTLCNRLAEALKKEQGRADSLALSLHRCEREQGDLHAQLKAMDEVAEIELAELRSKLAAVESERNKLRAGATVSRDWTGDLDDLQGFIDVVADGAVTPDDIAVAREALQALQHKLERG